MGTIAVLGTDHNFWLENGPFIPAPTPAPALALTLQRNQRGYNVSYEGTGFPSGHTLESRVDGWSDNAAPLGVGLHYP
jgi:hypothetical protein